MVNIPQKVDNHGFSLVELVVVIGVLSILSAVAIPNFICIIRKIVLIKKVYD